jgi:hypothetical protein
LVRLGDLPFSQQYDKARTAASFDHYGEAVWGALWMEHASTVKSLPEYAFQHTLSLNVRVPVGDGHRDITMSLPQRMPVPAVLPDNALIEGSASWDARFIKLRPVPHWDGLVGEVTAWVDTLNTIDSQRKAFRRNLEKLLGAYSSLAPALKAWPPLWDLLPDDVKEKHKDVTKREKKEVALDGIDLSSMTATLTVRKLLGGS